MSIGSIAPLVSAGAPPKYGSYWVGDWILVHGWGGFDNAMKTAKAAGVTPVIYHYYWGDSISPYCFDADGCNGRNEADWHKLTDQLAARVQMHFGGSEVLIVLENEFNKGGITGDFAPTFDAKLEAVAKKLNAVSGVKLIVGFGAWAEHNWVKFPKTVAQSEYVGYQMMRASTRDTESSYRAAADRSAYLSNFIAEKFNKPSFLYDVALSSYPDDHWARVQAETLDAIFQTLKTSGNTGLQGVVYRSLNDHYMSPENYYGLAESHWGLRTKEGVPKPAFDVWLAHAKGTTAPTAPPAPNLPGAFEAETMAATKGGKYNDAAASGGAGWNLWSNGELSTTLVAEDATHARIEVVARGDMAAGVAPRMELRLGGALLGAFDVPAGYATYALDAQLPAGSSRLGIHFTNDAVINGEDRNLRVDVVRVALAKPNTAPVAEFAASADGLTLSVDASASSDAEGDALSYAWSFGDGNGAAGVTASHTYAAGGDYTVTLTVSDGEHASSASRTVSVARPNSAPAAAFAASTSMLSASFDASASSDADGDALSYEWTFGDGNTFRCDAAGCGPTAAHDYAAPGNYVVTLTVGDGKAWASAERVVIATYPAPIAKATATGTEQTFAFDGSGSSDPAGGAITYEWSFGDGATAIGATATHSYAPGSYTATLTVTNRFGEKATDSVTITAVAPPPPAAYSASFTPRNGNEWWLQVKVDANAPTSAVCATINDGACQPLELKSWGDWAASYRAPSGSKVVFTATSASGERVSSIAYGWPTGQPYVEPMTATFTPYDGNNWWVQTRVESNREIASVCASVDGGTCRALTLKPWGAWAASFRVATGALIQFTATSTAGEKVNSQSYAWPGK